jgi:hypothetical protein
VYVNDGLWTVLVFPSPKSHDHDVGELVEVSVNCTVRGAVPEATLFVKLATGTVTAEVNAEVTVMRLVWVQALLPAAFVAVRDTV